MGCRSVLVIQTPVASRIPAMNQEASARRAAFRQLHESGHFIIPNPWDIGGVRLSLSPRTIKMCIRDRYSVGQ